MNRSYDWMKDMPGDKNVIQKTTWVLRRNGLSGKVPYHIDRLKSALPAAVPPRRGASGHLDYKREIAGLISALILHLTEID